jgi:hypothetical protein
MKLELDAADLKPEYRQKLRGITISKDPISEITFEKTG